MCAAADLAPVQDDNLLACPRPHVEAVFAMLRRQGRRVEFTGGLEALSLQDYQVGLLADLKPQPRCFFAYDPGDAFETLQSAAKRLIAAGFRTRGHRLLCYVLIGFPHDTFDAAEKRLRDVLGLGFTPFAMLWRPETPSAQKWTPPAEWRGFQKRWARPAIIASGAATSSLPAARIRVLTAAVPRFGFSDVDPQPRVLVTMFQQIVELEPAFDRRDPDPAKNYGIHGAEARWVLKGPAGAVQFLLFTNRHTRAVQRELVANMRHEHPEVPVGWLLRVAQLTDERLNNQNVVRKVQEQAKLLAQAREMLGTAACLFQPQPKPMYEGHEPIRYQLKPPQYPELDGTETHEEQGEKLAQFVPAVYGDPLICPYLDGDVPCYYDGSSLNAERVYERMLADGEAAIWGELESYYRRVFEPQ